MPAEDRLTFAAGPSSATAPTHQEPAMAFEYRNPTNGDRLTAVPLDDDVWLKTSAKGALVPPDRVEEVIAGIRDAARQATGQADTETHVVADDSDDPECIDDCPGCEVGIEHTEHCPTPETHNWGCGCPTDQAPAVGQPAEAQATDEAEDRTSETTWSVVFQTTDSEHWNEWSKGWPTSAAAIRSAEPLVGATVVPHIRFERVTVHRERFSLHQLVTTQDAAGAES
ncbi:hypothetical protein [Streptomyces tanashiensis]|uniref:hypothetical protein n=1 Tax=Streptomyces tanashiensis TaxID=67367 RepID=UPI0033EAC836